MLKGMAGKYDPRLRAIMSRVKGKGLANSKYAQGIARKALRRASRLTPDTTNANAEPGGRRRPPQF